MNTRSEEWQIANRTIRVSHLEKVFRPDAGFTKRDMLHYYMQIYMQIASVALPHFQQRPVTLRVFPEVAQGTSFYQRERSEYAPDWLPDVSYRPKTRKTRKTRASDQSG